MTFDPRLVFQGLAVAAGGAVVACASLSGLTGGGAPEDAGVSSYADGYPDAPETGMVHDAVAEAMPLDAAADSAPEHDAVAEAMPLDAAADSAPERDSAADAGACATATICDEFARTVLIPMNDPCWNALLCDTDAGASMTVDGSLNVDQPANGAGYCYLESYRSSLLTNPVPSVGSFNLEFDLVFDTSVQSGDFEVASVSVYKLNGDQEDIQLLIAGDGTAQLIVLYSSEGYLAHQLGSFPAPGTWVTPDKKCHISLAVDAKIPSGTGTATCNGVSQSLSNPDPAIPPGFAGPAVLNFGYANFTGNESPKWTLTYDSLLFTASP